MGQILTQLAIKVVLSNLPAIRANARLLLAATATKLASLDASGQTAALTLADRWKAAAIAAGQALLGSEELWSTFDAAVKAQADAIMAALATAKKA